MRVARGVSRREHLTDLSSAAERQDCLRENMLSQPPSRTDGRLRHRPSSLDLATGSDRRVRNRCRPGIRTHLRKTSRGKFGPGSQCVPRLKTSVTCLWVVSPRGPRRPVADRSATLGRWSTASTTSRRDTRHVAASSPDTATRRVTIAHNRRFPRAVRHDWRQLPPRDDQVGKHPDT